MEPSLMRGLPEAMCAFAVQSHGSLETRVYMELHHLDQPSLGAWCERPGLTVEQIIHYLIHCTLPTHKKIPLFSNLKTAMSFLAGALHFGWFSSLAHEYGQCLDQDKYKQALCQICEDTVHKHIQILHDAYRHYQITLRIREEKKIKLQSANRYALPGPDTASRFGPKAIEILKSIPPTCYTLPGKSNISLHIRFFEVKKYTFPVCVLLACPDTKFWDVLRLPDDLQLFPFSEQAFQWIWLRIAFIIHLGIQTEEDNPYARRVRPSKFKLQDVDGDRHFADFLQVKCFSIPGTKVELEDYDKDRGDGAILGVHQEEMSSIGSKKLFQIEKQLVEEERVTHSLQVNFWLRFEHTFRRPFELSRSCDGNQQLIPKNSPQEASVLNEVATLKNMGGDLFTKMHHAEARSLYLKAFSRLRCLRTPSRNVMQTAAALLSNHAICCLEIAKTQDTETGVQTLKEAIIGCNLVLEGNNIGISTAISIKLLRKLKFRRDLAASRRPYNIDEFYQAMIMGDDGIRLDAPCRAVFDLNFNLRLFSSDSQERHKKTQTDYIQILTGKHMLQHEGSEECPICLEQFSVGLAEKFVSIFPCGHLHCAKCFLKYQSYNDDMRCAICRKTISKQQWQGAIEDIVSLSAPALLEKIVLLPLESPADRIEVLRALLLKKGFDPKLVGSALDEMLYFNGKGTLRQAADLSANQKQQIYLEARRPIQLCEERLDELQRKLKSLQVNTNEYSQVKQQEREILHQLCQISNAAVDEIFSKINSAGSMA
mmetsp:Transcript_12243/g.22953  ORF Transcript_12243/g.22953 Transcript_12243/m.22953 type:complete len:767 (-) Transcript_12243:650-2950(-)